MYIYIYIYTHIYIHDPDGRFFAILRMWYHWSNLLTFAPLNDLISVPMVLVCTHPCVYVCIYVYESASTYVCMYARYLFARIDVGM